MRKSPGVILERDPSPDQKKAKSDRYLPTEEDSRKLAPRLTMF